MNYEFLYRFDFLIIRLSGTVRVNERLMVKKRLTPHLQRSSQKVIVDLEGLDESEGVYVLGILNLQYLRLSRKSVFHFFWEI
jgi:hypothetical protein